MRRSRADDGSKTDPSDDVRRLRSGRRQLFVALVVVAATGIGVRVVETKRKPLSGESVHALPVEARRYCAVVTSLRVDAPFPALDQPRDALEQQFIAMTARFQEAASTAPPAVAADVNVFNTIYRQVVDALRGVDYDASKLAPEEAAALGSPELESALQRVSAYDKRVCG